MTVVWLLRCRRRVVHRRRATIRLGQKPPSTNSHGHSCCAPAEHACQKSSVWDGLVLTWSRVTSTTLARFAIGVVQHGRDGRLHLLDRAAGGGWTSRDAVPAITSRALFSTCAPRSFLAYHSHCPLAPLPCLRLQSSQLGCRALLLVSW